MTQWTEFDSAEAAIAYRRDHGTGGWIFVHEDGGAVICPRGMTVSRLMLHPMCRGNGRFI
jgi:hypothetical protein